MINYKKLKSQIHRGGLGYVFEPTVEQLDKSDWEIFTDDACSKRQLLKELRKKINNPANRCWRKEFCL